MSGFEPQAVIVFFAPTRTLTVHIERTKQQSYIRTYKPTTEHQGASQSSRREDVPLTDGTSPQANARISSFATVIMPAFNQNRIYFLFYIYT